MGRQLVTALGVDRLGPVLTLTLDRPERLNALTEELSDALAGELEAAAAYDDVRVVVLRGAGRAFCAGADIADPDAPARLEVRALDRANRVVRAVTRLDKPVVAAVHGSAAGVGCSIALACDLAVAAESSSFLLAFARVGLMPDGGSSATVAASIGRARAMRMALLGEPLTGRQAYDAGLVSHLADDDTFQTVVSDLVARLAAGAPLAQAATKRAVNAAAYGGLDAALERERTGQTMLLRTRDAAEGMRAFADRRAPDFEGE
jgi:enoyl-CoA hydratase